jgi:integrase
VLNTVTVIRRDPAGDSAKVVMKITDSRFDVPTTAARLGSRIDLTQTLHHAPGLPDGFRYHDLRHYLASLLIAEGADVKTVQARLRHASAKTTLDTYGHLWPDRDESTRAAIEAVFQARTAPSRPGESAL